MPSLNQDKISLSVKFSLAVGLILFIFCSLYSVLLYYYLRNQMLLHAEEKAMIIMNQLRSVSDYVKETLRPATFRKMKELNRDDEFIIEAMSTTHVSYQIMDRFSREFKDYRFSRVSDNPMNPNNRADSFHEAMLHYFRHSKGNNYLWKGIIGSDDERVLIHVRPVFMEDGCLKCHGRPEDAPRELLKRYPLKSGFHWKVGDVVGVESVSVSIKNALSHVKDIAVNTFIFGLSTLGGLYLAIYWIFRNLVTRPLNVLSETFRKISEGKERLNSVIPVNRTDEIGELTRSFSALSRHLLEAEAQLKKTAEIERQMMETEKLSSLGQLSAGVAHEINNPLGGMQLCFNNLISTEMDRTTRERHIEVINSGFDRIQTIVRQLLDFAKDSPLKQTELSINKILENVLNLITYTISKKNINIVKDLYSDMPDITGDANKLEQVFLNIIINAVQAMPDGGTLTIKTWYDGSYCYASVTDTGIGIPEGIRSKVFDPFFTTKGVQQGTGLGLTVSKAIVEQHRGSINFKTRPGETTFTVSLPIQGNGT